MPDRVTMVKGRDQAAWLATVNQMINRGAPITEDELPMLIEYLAANWPEGGKGPDIPVYAPLRPMAAHMSAGFQEWDVPTPNAGPHDSLAAADGSIWYAGQKANVLGRLDPKTGLIKEFKLKTPDSGPRGLAEDKNGNIWYTASLKAHLGKLDPKTGQVTEYPMPDPAARDPQAAVFDQKGNLWFTVQGANMVGRFNPANGDLTLRNSPTLKSMPSGIVVSSKGVPYYVESGASKVASIDPASMVIREWTLPAADARPSRLALDANDVIWYSDAARGYLGRLDPTSGEVKEWAAPGGAQSKPTGVAVIKGDVWFSETYGTPNTVVRFEPSTERFQVWNIPSGGGVVENVSVTKDGNLALAETGVNKIALMEISR